MGYYQQTRNESNSLLNKKAGRKSQLLHELFKGI